MTDSRKIDFTLTDEEEKTLLKLKILEALKCGNKPLANYFKSMLEIKEKNLSPKNPTLQSKQD